MNILDESLTIAEKCSEMGPKRRGAAGGSSAKSEPGASSGRSKVIIVQLALSKSYMSSVVEICAEQQHPREAEGNQQPLDGNHEQDT